jgi:riboflavin synthase
MKNTGIQNKKRFIEITINEDEAKQILKDLYQLDLYERQTALNQNTVQLINMLEKFEREK